MKNWFAQWIASDDNGFYILIRIPPKWILALSLQMNGNPRKNSIHPSVIEEVKILCIMFDQNMSFVRVPEIISFSNKDTVKSIHRSIQ